MSGLRQALDRFKKYDYLSFAQGQEDQQVILNAAEQVADGTEVWWCEHLSVGYVKDDDAPDARSGLEAWCREVHHGSCGWRFIVAFVLPAD